MRKAILKTLVYADIFDYPLREKEIKKYLICPKEVNCQIIREDKLIKQKQGYFYLKGREKIIAIRKKRKIYSEKKLEIAYQAANWLKLIPWIKMVGLTGALAMENVKDDDDIDFLIISAKKRLWLTRLLTVLLIELVAKRRRPDDKKFKDKICLNMFLDEGRLTLPENERNLFSSHEICQLKVLWQKKGVYKKFISKNRWLKKYLANWKP